MKILITGSSGFIGSHCVKHLSGLPRAFPHEIVCYDKKNDLQKQNLIYGIDIADDIEAVIHFAAETFVDDSIKDPFVYLSNNIIGTHNLLEALRFSNVKRYIQISTDEVYGARVTPADEYAPLNPGNPYSATKAAADMLALAYHNTYGIPLIIARPENNYGTGQGGEKFIPTIIRCALEGKPVPIYGDGRHTRMWLHVEDTCRAIETLLEKGEDGQIYNIGGGEQWRNLDIATHILDEMKITHPTRFKTIPDEEARPGHDRSYCIDNTKILDLGWNTQRNVKESIGEVIAWQRENYTLKN